MHASQAQPGNGPGPSSTAVSSSDQPDLLLCTSTTLAHMAESLLAGQSEGGQRNSNHSQSSDNAMQLGLILSLLIYIGGLSSSSVDSSSQPASRRVAEEQQGTSASLGLTNQQAATGADDGLEAANQQAEVQAVSAEADGVQRGDAGLLQHPCQDICLQVWP